MLIGGHIDRKQHGWVIASVVVGFYRTQHTQTGLNEEGDYETK
jgi:hypothetical protein